LFAGEYKLRVGVLVKRDGRAGDAGKVTT